jgi:hypothetical protein
MRSAKEQPLATDFADNADKQPKEDFVLRWDDRY